MSSIVLVMRLENWIDFPGLLGWCVQRDCLLVLDAGTMGGVWNGMWEEIFVVHLGWCQWGKGD